MEFHIVGVILNQEKHCECSKVKVKVTMVFSELGKMLGKFGKTKR